MPYGPAGFGAQYSDPEKKKKKTPPGIANKIPSQMISSSWGSRAFKNRPTTPSAMEKVKEAATKRNVRPRQSFKRGPMQDWQNAANAYGVRGDISPDVSVPSRSGNVPISKAIKRNIQQPPALKAAKTKRPDRQTYKPSLPPTPREKNPSYGTPIGTATIKSDFTFSKGKSGKSNIKPGRPGPVDDVVGPNRPPLELKKSAIKRRIRRVGGPVTTAAKKRKKYGGM